MRDPQAGLGGDERMNTRAVMASLATLTALAAGIAVAGTGPAAAIAKIPAGRGGGIARRTEAAGAVLGSSPGAGAAGAAGAAGVAGVACTAPAAYRPFAARLSAGIEGALRGRAGHQAVTVRDQLTGISCQADAGRQFDSASIVKVIILAALLRWHQETGTPLSLWENGEATLMITRSDNDAASDLWQWVGMGRLQRFLNLAAMRETVLGPSAYWGLTQVTANDEMLLLDLLTLPNTVLSDGSRSYELALMARVIPGQRWGTPAGAPAGVTVHVKNGWLPDATGWHINSIGAFTGKGADYAIAVLTDDNPSEQYGIDTIQDVARLAHRELSAARAAAGVRLAANVAPSPAAAPSPGTAAPVRPAPPTPWAEVPALPALPAQWAVVPALPGPPGW